MSKAQNKLELYRQTTLKICMSILNILILPRDETILRNFILDRHAIVNLRLIANFILIKFPKQNLYMVKIIYGPYGTRF